MNLNSILLCACGAAYGIDPVTGKYAPNPIYSDVVAFNAPGPTVISAPSGKGGTSSDPINACLVGQNANGIIVAFRGTLPLGTPDSFEDWLQDFFAEPVLSSPLPGLVHDGFITAVNSIIDAVIKAVQSFQPSSTNPVFVTGHSKGGGMAPLAAYLLYNAGITTQQVVTFAAPKSGNSEFKTGYQKVFPTNHTRYENYGDIAPLVPPADAFSGWMAKLVSIIPDIGPDLEALFNKAAGWDYQPVGTELFIESAKDDYAINSKESDLEQVGDFAYNLTMNLFDPLTALANAHTIACGYGYMSGVCPSGICP